MVRKLPKVGESVLLRTPGGTQVVAQVSRIGDSQGMWCMVYVRYTLDGKSHEGGFAERADR